MAIAAPLPAAETAPSTEKIRESILRMTEFFDTTLPGVLGPRNMALEFRPKFGDLRDYEYVRLPFELRYGLTDRWELRGGLSPFLPNPINGGSEHRWGPGEGKLGARFDLGRSFHFFDETTVGADVRIPLGRPPIRLNDHYTHVRPFITASRKLHTWPATTFYANVSYDHSFDLTHRDSPPATVVRQNIIEVAPGLLYKPTELGYFGEYRIRHIREDVGWHLSHEFQVGTIWDVPLARTKKWKLPGKWQLELGYKVRLEEGHERDHGLSARVNWRTTLREVVESGKTLSSR